MQTLESDAQRASEGRNESEEPSWPQSEQDKERNTAEVMETVGGGFPKVVNSY